MPPSEVFCFPPVDALLLGDFVTTRLIVGVILGLLPAFVIVLEAMVGLAKEVQSAMLFLLTVLLLSSELSLIRQNGGNRYEYMFPQFW